MKWNMSVKDLTTIGICIAVAVVLGKLLGVLYRIVPFSRGIINAPFFTVTFLIESAMYRFEGPLALLISVVTVYLAGLVGSISAMTIFPRRLFHNDSKIGSEV